MTWYLWTILLLALLPILSGCTSMVVGSFMRPIIANLQRQTDIDLVCEGTPAFMLMIDSLITANPSDKKLLLTATQAFVGCRFHA